ncbi:hypothetical protein [Nissabacter archeti]|uniref:hypothetical protein n=1 Tax=Nissabacter archeti TaxID=1917880 RepID=UPI001FE56EBE|nr:hypothetical protein [Nissabacter archeti]
MITFQNDGQLIAWTNYWQSELAIKGFFFLSWNAGAARLLIPDVHQGLLRETTGTEFVIITRGKLQGTGGV